MVEARELGQRGLNSRFGDTQMLGGGGRQGRIAAIVLARHGQRTDTIDRPRRHKLRSLAHGPRPQQRVGRVDHDESARGQHFDQPAFGRHVRFPTAVPIEMVGRAAGDHGAQRRANAIAQMRELKTTHFEDHPVVGFDLGQLVEQADADVAAQPGSTTARRQACREHGGRCALAVGAGHRDDRGRTAVEEQLGLGGHRDAAIACQGEQRALGPHGRINHNRISVGKIGLVVPAERPAVNRHIGQGRDRFTQVVGRGQIGHRDQGPLPGQPAGGRHAASMPAQAHHGHALAGEIHLLAPARENALRSA